MFDLKKQLMWSKLRVGIVITLALIILLITVFFAGGLINLFLPKVELSAHIQDVKGLRKGAPIWISGIEVGSVKRIQLDPVHGTIIVLSINKSALEFIKKDSRASVLTKGLLGDKYVEISLGSPGSETIKPNDMIQGTTQIELKDAVEIGTTGLKRMSDFIEKLQNFVVRIEKGEGTLSQLLTDPAVYHNLRESTQAFSVIVRDFKNSQGTLRMLIDDPSLYQRMTATAASLETFTKKITESSGTIKALVEDPSLYNKMVLASTSLEEFSKRLNEGQGTLRRLTEDAELYDNLSKASIKLATILERIEKGEGVAGTLVKDQELANQLKAVVYELNGLVKDMKEQPTKYFKFSLF